jgi:hypothetical protein
MIAAPTLASLPQVVVKARSCAPALLLPLLVVLLACKSDPGEDTGGSSTGDMCSDDVRRRSTPTTPHVTCDFKCDEGAKCRFRRHVEHL